MSTAGILIIGNEILSGKVEDENAPYLLRELRKLGVDVERVYTLPDEVDVLAEELRAFAKAFTYVLTTGGVGPTHDDVTMEAVAKGFNVELCSHPRMEDLLRRALKGKEPNPSQLKMCMLPDGADLIEARDLWFPLVKLKNVFIFPGIPRLLRAKFEDSSHCFQGRPIYLRRVFVTCMESDIAQALHDLLAAFPELKLGSYPRLGEPDYHTLVTLESRDEGYVSRAVETLVEQIPSESLVRVE